jgi:hypothetical protein
MATTKEEQRQRVPTPPTTKRQEVEYETEQEGRATRSGRRGTRSGRHAARSMTQKTP